MGWGSEEVRMDWDRAVRRAAIAPLSNLGTNLGTKLAQAGGCRRG